MHLPHQNCFGSWQLALNSSLIEPKAILVVGSINADLLAYVDDSKRIGNYVFGDDFRFNLGGKGLNQAVNVANSGQNVILIGRVGDDFFGHEILRQLLNRGVKVNHIVKDRIGHTGIGHVRVSVEGEYSTVVINGANSFLDTDQIDGAILQGIDASFVLMNYEVLSDVVHYAARKFRELGIQTVINLSPIADGITYSVECADYLITNEDEARAVLGTHEQSTQVLAEMLKKQGAKNVIITRGSKGVFAIDQAGNHHSVERVPVSIENTIGAGDTFLAIFTTALNLGATFELALEVANSAAARVCTKQESFLSSEDIEDIAEEFAIELPKRKIIHGTEHLND